MSNSNQIDVAISQCIDYCEILLLSYTPVSLRDALTALGYDRFQADAVIKDCAARGFEYCNDPMIVSTHFDPNNPLAVNDMVTEYPPRLACKWGPDQLQSRLYSLRSR